MNASRMRTTVLLTTLMAVASGVVGYRLVTLHAGASASAAALAQPADPAGRAEPAGPAGRVKPAQPAGPASPGAAAARGATNADGTAEPPVASKASSTTAAPRPPDVTSSPPPRPPVRTPVPAPPPAPADNGFGCRAALAYLAAHEAPGFIDVCRPHAASGGYGYTCVDHWPQCPGRMVIVIACPAPIVYQNEASNSLVMSGLSHAPLDPYGQYDRRCPPYA